jgi:WD40 repeat protein
VKPVSGLDETTLGKPVSGLEQTAAPDIAGPVAAIELPVVDPKHYTRLGEFARGGLGRIVRARDERTGRVVALKEILELGNDDVAQRFAREARVTANLMHPAIVPVYELGRWPSGEPFYAMKLVAGKSLKDVIDETKPFADRLAKLSLVIAVADALAYAHAQRVIHRDLKPGNVLVGEFGETVVIDWGLAKVLDRPDDVAAPSIVALDGMPTDRTMAGAVMGTPFYMPPEQALGRAADQRADVYAIGAMLYHLIAGAPPFADQRPKDLAELLALVSTKAPTPLASREPATPPDLVTIVEKAMAAQADARYPSARELADELRRFTAGQLVQAHRYSRRTLVVRWLRRHRAAVTVAAILLAVLIGGTVLSVGRIVGERDRAVAAEQTATDEATRARRGLATALYQKGRGAEAEHRWALAAMYYAAARTHLDTPEGRWAAGLAEARAITPHARHLGHDHAINAVALSPDATTAVTVDLGGTVRVWSMRDGPTLATRKLPAPLWSVAIAPSGDELAIGGDAGAIYRLSLALAPLGELRGHGKRVWSLAYAPDGKSLASGSEDATIRVWSLPGGASRELRGHAQRVYSVAFSPDGTQLVSGADDRQVRVWTLATGAFRSIGAHVGGGVRVVAFTPDGKSVLSTGWNYEIKLWPLGGGAPLTWQDRHSVHAAVITPDGRAIVSAGDTGAIRIWEAATRALVTTLDAPGGRTTGLAVSRDGRWLVSAGHSRVPVVYDLAASPRLLDAGGHRESITSIVFTARGDAFVTGSDDRTIRMWTPDGKELRRITTTVCNESPRPLGGIGDPVIASCQDQRIRRWRGDGSALPEIATSRYLEFISIAADRRTLAGGHLDGILQQIDLDAGTLVRERKLHSHQIYIVEHATDGGLLTAGLDNQVKLWTPELEPIRAFTAQTTDGLLAATISPDRRFVVAAGQDGTLDIWATATGEHLAHRIAHEALITEIAFSADSTRLFTAGDDDRIVKIWDTATWTAIATLDPKEDGVLSLARSPDDRLLVTGHRSGALVIWDLATRTPRHRIGGRSREHGRCDDLAAQVWVDDAHRAIVLAACTSTAPDYQARYAARARLRISGEVDVVEDWR